MEFQLQDPNRSEFVRSLRFLAGTDGIPMHLADGLRRLTEDEVRQLTAQGNLCRDWSQLRVAHDFLANSVVGNHFLGSCVLGRFADDTGLPAGIYHSTVAQSTVGNEARVYRCPMVDATVVDRAAFLLDSRISGVDGAPAFANGLELTVGIETGGREIEIYADITPDLAKRILLSHGDGEEAQSYRRYVADYRRYASVPWTYLGPESRLDGATVRASWLGPHATVRDRSVVSGSTVLSNRDEPSVVTGGAHVQDSIVQWGCEVRDLALVRRSVLMEHATVEHHGTVQESILGSNSVVGGGEVTASFLGPFVSAHHQSLVIAAFWPQGRGNIGYGANVGSNHTSRAPDQEVWPGEGMFFGLDSAVKFPANFSDAPYTVIATGIVTPPQRMEFPFSLIAETTDHSAGAALNRLIPAWMLRRNLYAVMRSEAKIRQRNRATRTQFDFGVFRHEILDTVAAAADRLAIPDRDGSIEPVYLPGTIPGLGQNALLEEDRRAAIEAYQMVLSFGRLRERYEAGDTLDPGDRRTLGELMIAIVVGVRESRDRDLHRGETIIPDYRATHPAVDQDHFVRQVTGEARAMLEALELPDLTAKLD